MDFLGKLMGDGDQRKQEEYRDFTNRYDQGAPYDRISDEEAALRYGEVAPGLSNEEYRLSAREAFERMSPEERMEFGRLMQQEARHQGHGDFIDRNHDGVDDRFQDPDYLASTMGRMRQEQPDVLGSIMGSAAGGGLLGGLTGGSGHGGSSPGGLMGLPVAKSAVAGIAAMAAKRMMGGR